ncbi:hypothetical protein L211DRAFT_832151 [Terfezia boudieri ATCC MYA-4762]|uniref:J domain-containing protein n=1 Tax=Terfezia boudieri ATCC MYA-4762 TaxID=1051890 RepID=A0A3N4M2Q3_9PEZI|nr:hypothetical protein L211DRAFT_832151 [Terfezia boudieri ATCC MYA-4762]
MLHHQHKLFLRQCGGSYSRAWCRAQYQLQNSLVLRRSYATPIDTPPEPTPIWPSNLNPTPYQIFNCAKGEAYSKRRYYELCMLYHPDRFCTGEHKHGVSDEVRNDRFRLVVAANEILGDPVKRRAYDRYGIGWAPGAASRHGVGARGVSVYRHATSGPQHKWWTRGAWSAREGHEEQPDPHNNATWEDWEKYHAWRDGRAHAQYTQPQQPVFTSNATFISILFCVVSVGSLLSITNAQKNGELYIADREKMHAAISRDMERRRREARELGHKDERVRNFLRQRDPEGLRTGEELAGGRYSRLLQEEQQPGSMRMMDGVRAPPRIAVSKGPHGEVKGVSSGTRDVEQGQMSTGCEDVRAMGR